MERPILAPQPLTALPRLYTVKELAESLHKQPQTVRAMAARGEIGYHRVGKELLFPEPEVLRLLNRTYRPPRRSVQ